MSSDFEQIKRTAKDGQEYWTSRELCNALGYSTYQKFTRILNKAIAVANGKGMKTADHFNQTVEMVKLGSGTFRKVENMLCTVEYDYPKFHLSMLCYMCRISNGEIDLREHKSAQWLTKETLDDVEWLPADVEVIKLLKE